jgi:four helix bundle protein
MDSHSEALKLRARSFALRVIRLFRALPASAEARVIGSQLLRSATSVAANYRAACRGRSRAEFLSKIGVVVEEADETVFWLELLVDADLVPKRRLNDLIREAQALLAIFAATQLTTKRNLSKSLGRES